MAKTEFPSQGLDKFVVRLPEGMRERIAEAAKTNNRSMNSQVVAMLEEASSFEEERRRMQVAIDTIADALNASHRMLSLTGFYLRNCAARVPRDSEETRQVMENIEIFANAIYHGDMNPTALRNIIDIGVEAGVIDPDTRQAKPEYRIDHPEAAKAKRKR